MSGSVTAIADTCTHRQSRLTPSHPGLPCVEHPRQRNGGKNRIIHKPTTATFSCNVGHSAHPPPRGRTSVPPDQQPPQSSIRPNQLRPPAFRLADERARGIVAVSRADEYRRRAQQCLEMAGTFRDREARIVLSHMAEVWLRLAERNVPKQTQPAFQQQQQIQPKDDYKE